jgi:hypothetical protein
MSKCPSKALPASINRWYTWTPNWKSPRHTLLREKRRCGS